MKNIIKTGTACIIIFLTGALSLQARGGNDHNGNGRNDQNRGQQQASYDNRNNHQRDGNRHDHRRDQGHRNNYNQPAHNNHNKGYTHGNSFGVQVSIGRAASHHNCDCASGYWKNTQRRIWVPASIEWRIEPCGTRIRVRTPGRWKFVSHLIWVAGHRPTCRY